MKKIFSILALTLAAMTASADEAPSYNIEKKANDVTIKVNGAVAETAKQGDEVTVVVTPPEGKNPATVVCRPFTDWGQAKTRAAEILMSGSFLASKVKGVDNTYTFTMPAKNIEVGVTYFETIPVTTQEADNEENEVDGVTMDYKLSDEKDPEIDSETGQTVVYVEVDNINVQVQDQMTELTVVIQPQSTSADGETVFVVTSIGQDAFKTEDGTNAQVVTVVLPQTEQPINIEDGAMQPEGRVLKVIAPLQMLDDYANMMSLKDNVQEGKVSATATPKNMYWTFSSGIDVLLPEGVKAYKVMWSGNTIEIQELTDDELKLDGNYRGIKKNNGVLLSCEVGEGGNDYEVFASPAATVTGAKPATDDAKDYAGNCLVPTIEAYHYAPGQYLIMKANEFHTIGSAATKVPACKAVLKIN